MHSTLPCQSIRPVLCMTSDDSQVYLVIAHTPSCAVIWSDWGTDYSSSTLHRGLDTAGSTDQLDRAKCAHLVQRRPEDQPDRYRKHRCGNGERAIHKRQPALRCTYRSIPPSKRRVPVVAGRPAAADGARPARRRRRRP
eukprot:COSAG02_NODE_2884_length_7815_cov_95.201503_1_plen_138_part_10